MNSDNFADILFVNERPGRIGPGQSGYVSFDNNDPSANFFKECFELAGLRREKVFITNACLCHPDYPGYKDTAPNDGELVNCHFWLEKQIEITDPKLIITIGKKAFESVLRYYECWVKYKNIAFLSQVGKLIRETDP